MRFFTILLIPAIPMLSFAQTRPFYFGHDLSYANQMEDCGAVFRENSKPKDVYRIFADRGSNLVRVRLWVDPSWWQSPLQQPQGVKPYYNDFEDVRETVQRAKAAGMQVMLDIHYSDFWADPGRQLIPRRWLKSAYDVEALKDSVYNYTADVLSKLDHDGLMPEIVKIGNENDSGILRHIPAENGYEPIASVSDSWARHAQLFNAAIKAVRDVGANASIRPKIALHFSGQLTGQVGKFQNIVNNGVTDFDIIGISYYYAWHGGSIALLLSTIRDLTAAFPGREVMVVETAYMWTTRNFDQLANIVTEPDPAYLPVIPEKQLEYMVDYTRAVMRGGGTGVVFWEPAWVSTQCRTPWGQGSSQDHIVFFDPTQTNFMENGGGRWPERHFYEDLNAHKVTFKVDMSGQDVSNGVYITGSFTGKKWQIVPMADEGNHLYSYFAYLPADSAGAYYFLNGNDWRARETVPAEGAVWSGTDRGFVVPDKDAVFAFRWGSVDPIGALQKMEINLKNPSFEEPGTTETGFKNVPGWSTDAPATKSGVSKNDHATDGIAAAWLASQDPAVWQLTDYTIQKSDEITLSVDVRNSWQATEFTLILYYDDNGKRVHAATAVKSVSNSMTKTTLTFSTDEVQASVGHLLGVAIDNTSAPDAYIEIDNIRLTKSNFTSAGSGADAPVAFALAQNYPNPFNSRTTISYRIPQTAHAVLRILNTLGQEIMTLVDGQQPAGRYRLQFDAGDLSSGTYLYQIQAGELTDTKTFTLIK